MSRGGVRSGAASDGYRISQLVLSASFLAVLAVVFLLDAEGDRVRVRGTTRAIPDLCRTHAETGRPCGSCGLTRGVVLAARGRLDAASAHHRAAPAFLGLLVLQVALRPLLARRRWRARAALAAAITDFGLHVAVVGLLIDPI